MLVYYYGYFYNIIPLVVLWFGFLQYFLLIFGYYIFSFIFLCVMSLILNYGWWVVYDEWEEGMFHYRTHISFQEPAISSCLSVSISCCNALICCSCVRISFPCRTANICGIPTATAIKAIKAIISVNISFN